ncbi:MAG: HIRAN domain-containing protein [Ruminococcus sp.]|nr:HIRAN domain-containing protein [Ruminococcus sp.]
MLKDFRRKVMQIANRLVGQGYIRACAMKTAWKLIKAHAVSTKVAGTSFDNRQNVLALLAKYNPADVSVKLVRDRSNTFDSNAVAVTAAVKGKVSAVIGYLPKAVASVVAALMDKGLHIMSDTFSIVGGYSGHENYGARIIVKI